MKKTTKLKTHTLPIIMLNISCLCTLNGENAKNKLFRRGNEMNDIGVIKNGAIIFDKEKIIFVGTTSDVFEYLKAQNIPIEIINDIISSKHLRNIEAVKQYFSRIIKAKGLTVMPGLVDSHTHNVFAGNRSDEFIDRLQGATYSEISAKGGGIINTVQATRKATFEELYNNSLKIIKNAACLGTTTMEIKSGYCLNLEGELKTLEVIKKLENDIDYMNIVPTFMAAHDFPPEYKFNRKGYIDKIINEMIPLVGDYKLSNFCDIFIDDGYYTLDEAKQIFKVARQYNMKIKTHADEFLDTGATSFSVDMEAISADHLLCISDEGIKKLSNSNTVATLLPSTAYCMRLPYAPGRKIIDNDCIVAIATDCNPGSSFNENLQFSMSLAVMNMAMTPEEVITAVTINGAAALNISDKRGSLEVGKKADLIVFNCSHYNDIFYHIGNNYIIGVCVNGTFYVRKKSNLKKII